MDVLRYAKRVNFLRVAVTELNGKITGAQASKVLTLIAETLMQMVFVLVWRQQIAKR